jgi:alginate O-acetyltransferase complex protein AlgF
MNTHPPLRRFTLGACALALGLGMFQAQADDGALYGPKAPKGSAFVRAYNAGNAELDVNVGEVQLKRVAPLGSSDFEYLPAGSYQAQVGNAQLPVQLQAAHYYTLVSQTGSAPRLVEEPAFSNKQKALLRVQNLSDSPLSLKTADGKTAVVADVQPDGRGGLALFEGERKVADLKPVTLERGEVVSLFVTGAQGKLAPVWVKRPIDG